MKEKYEEMMAFIAQQDKEWEEHRRQIGLIGRFFENLLGSDFARKQLEEFQFFCKEKRLKE